MDNQRAVWAQFVAGLLAGPLGPERLAPYRPELHDSLAETLQYLADNVSDGWGSEPECFEVDSDYIFLTELVLAGQPKKFSFHFSADRDGVFRLRHIESISLRLDKLPPAPTSEFPDLPDGEKDWIREELALTEQVRLYQYLAAERGRPFALRWFCDGAGYALAARSWVPFVPPERAFVLYLCWEQTRLRGSTVTLERLDDNEACIRLVPLWCRIYSTASHLKERLTLDELRTLFECVWRDRANSAGWDIAVQYVGEECIFSLRRRAGATGGATSQPSKP